MFVYQKPVREIDILCVFLDDRMKAIRVYGLIRITIIEIMKQ